MTSGFNVGKIHPYLLHFPYNSETPILLSPVPSPFKLNLALRGQELVGMQGQTEGVTRVNAVLKGRFCSSL